MLRNNKSRRTTRPRVSKCGVDLRRSSLQPSPQVLMLGVWSGTGTAPVLHEFTFPPTSGPRGIVFCKFFSCEEKNQLKVVERLKPKTSWTKLLNATRTWYVTRRVWMILNDFEWFRMILCVCLCLRGQGAAMPSAYWAHDSRQSRRYFLVQCRQRLSEGWNMVNQM